MDEVIVENIEWNQVNLQKLYTNYLGRFATI